MIPRTDPAGIRRELEAGIRYQAKIGLADTVRENGNFFIGRQWEGLDAPDLEKPVLNILKRAVCYFVATVRGGEAAVSLTDGEDGNDALLGIYRREVERVFERDGTEGKLTDCLRAAAVEGDGCLYWSMDGGGIRSERIPNTDVFFLNPYEPDPERQRGILIRFRRPYDELRETALLYGVKEPDRILPDDPKGLDPDADETETLATAVLKLYKREGRVFAVIVTGDATVRPAWDTGLTRYPIAWMNWDKVAGSFHGQAAVTGLVPNQIIINKLFSMYVRSVEMNAFPKVVYDVTKFGRDGWTNRVGEAIGIYGDVTDAAVNVLRGGDTSSQVMQVIESAITLTRDTMGATDAAMGRIPAENTAASAIIASQNASREPLELQRRAFCAFYESCVRIVLDLMGAYYGVRTVTADGRRLEVDFAGAGQAAEHARVTVGEAGEWNETAAFETLKELLAAGVPVDPAAVIAAIPERLLPDKTAIMASLGRKEETDEEQGGER